MKKLVAALLLTATLVSGCATGTSNRSNTNNIDRIDGATSSDPEGFRLNSASKAGPPLPAGSRYETAGSIRPRPIRTENLVGSLRPDDSTPRKRVPEILKRGRLIVGVDQSHNLLSYREGTSGELRGFEIDLAHEIARDIFGDANKVDFRYIESSERAVALDSGAVDIVIRTMTMTAERQHQVDFSIPYLVTRTRMLVMQNSGINSIEDTAGHTICAATGSTALDRIRLEAPQANILATRSWGDCLMALQLSQVDAVITDDTLLSGMVEQDPYTEIVGEPLATEMYGVGIRKPDRNYNSAGLIRQVNSTLERIRRDGTWQEIYNKWFGEFLPVTTLPPVNYREEDRDDA